MKPLAKFVFTAGAVAAGFTVGMLFYNDVLKRWIIK